MKGYEQKVYLNNAATSWPKPDCVALAVSQALRSLPGDAGRGGIREFDVFDQVRKKLAALLGVACPERIALGSNSTWGLNQAIFGFPLEPRKACWPSTVWKTAVRKYRPRLCVLIHASNVTGAVNDAETLTAMAKDAGAAMLLDISQSLGWISVEMEKWGADMAAFTGHKYLLGPQGTGGLYVRPGLTLDPYVLGGTGVKSNLKEMPEEMPLHLEAGTGNEPSYHGLLAALQWAEENPLNREKTEEILRYLKKGLRDLGCRVIQPEPPVTPVLSFTIPGWHPGEVGDILSGSYDIICRTGLHCSPRIMENLGTPQGTIRLSLSRFTKRADADRVLEAVTAMCGDQMEET